MRQLEVEPFITHEAWIDRFASLSVDFHPGIERDGVAQVLSSGRTDRSTLFLTTKIRKPAVGTAPADAAKQVRAQIEADLAVLGVQKVDMLMLRDSPSCEVMQAQWAEMERVKRDGLTRSIGVVNYCQSSLECILRTATEAPASTLRRIRTTCSHTLIAFVYLPTPVAMQILQ